MLTSGLALGILFDSKFPELFLLAFFVFGLSKKIDIVFLNGSKILTRHSVWQKGEKMNETKPFDAIILLIAMVLLAIVLVGPMASFLFYGG